MQAVAAGLVNICSLSEGARAALEDAACRAKAVLASDITSLEGFGASPAAVAAAIKNLPVSAASAGSPTLGLSAAPGASRRRRAGRRHVVVRALGAARRRPSRAPRRLAAPDAAGPAGPAASAATLPCSHPLRATITIGRRRARPASKPAAACPLVLAHLTSRLQRLHRHASAAAAAAAAAAAVTELRALCGGGLAARCADLLSVLEARSRDLTEQLTGICACPLGRMGPCGADESVRSLTGAQGEWWGQCGERGEGFRLPCGPFRAC